jgi:hypothetical protein
MCLGCMCEGRQDGAMRGLRVRWGALDRLGKGGEGHWEEGHWRDFVVRGWRHGGSRRGVCLGYMCEGG